MKKLGQLEFIQKTANDIFSLHFTSPYRFKGTTSDYNVFFNEQDQTYNEVQPYTQIEAFLKDHWQKGFVHATDKWKVFFPHKNETILLPAGTKIRITWHYFDYEEENFPQPLGGTAGYENYKRKIKRNEAWKKAGLSGINDPGNGSTDLLAP
ncbi:hypothetical protein [Neobacillus niacini]|uniref:hypothetical protein n=1 Tax=Neobacillus niacini TaxID=86668 RepID=UPI0021CAF8D3|nr:hypothetical protein [Neobacillus niacini]MCM3763907.1 hypothetical protein [Neobacillus niacini]